MIKITKSIQENELEERKLHVLKYGNDSKNKQRAIVRINFLGLLTAI